MPDIAHVRRLGGRLCALKRWGHLMEWRHLDVDDLHDELLRRVGHREREAQ